MKSKMSQDDLEAEPSLDQMLDLSNPAVLSGLGKLAEMARERQAKAEEAKKAKEEEEGR